MINLSVLFETRFSRQ